MGVELLVRLALVGAFACAGAVGFAAGDPARVAEWEGGRREEVLEWFRSEWFGRAPVGKPADEKFEDRALTCAGGRVRINFHLTLPPGADAKHPVPVFVFGDHFNRQTSKGNLSVYPGIPTNSITAHGYAYVCVNFNDVCLNTYDTPEFNGSFTTGVHRVYGGLGRPDSWGTISAWAWCFSRTVDWIESRPELDASRIAVVGHSRGGKTALWAAAQDKRIAMVVSNNSGTGGARLLGCDNGDPRIERIEQFDEYRVAHWFCPNFLRYAGRERSMPHDADDLMRLVAPRLLYVASSSRDWSAFPEGEFAAAKRASELWTAYGKKAFAFEGLPATNSFDHTGSIAYHLKDGRHSLTAWDWERYLDFADRHLKARDELPALAAEFAAKGSYEARPPVLADDVKVDEDDFEGRVADIWTRLDGSSAAEDGERDIELKAWRNERVHAQVVVWTGKDRAGLRAEVSALEGPDGATLPRSAVSARFVRYVLGTDHRFERVNPYESYPDCLDTAERLPLPARSFRPVWLTVEVPADAKPGRYRGELVLRVNGGEKVVFPIGLKVLGRTLPAAKDRRFYLDLWQHPLGVARYHGVKPFSPEHYALLEPLYREIASAGQKVITATITDFPWGGGGTPGAYGSEYALNPIRGMVTYVRKADGSYAADFSLFDEYVEFCRKCGLGPRINCYTIVKFAGRETYQYVDERTGDLVNVDLKTGSEEWKAYMRPLIRLTADHLRAKGWFGDAAIAIDEAPPAKARMARELVREVEPEFPFALAGNVAWEKFGDLDVDDYSQILWHDYEKGDTFMTDNFLNAVRARGAAGKITTFYVCSIPGVHKPNNWMHSALVESEWIGLYAAAKGFSGFLRWAVVYWPRDPFFDSSYASHPAGETYFLYPGCRSSMRWEILRDGFEDWEKIRILRETGAATPSLEKALAAFDFPTMETADESAYRAQVRSVTDELLR